nr:hypothetical protein [Natronococcus sp. AD5]
MLSHVDIDCDELRAQAVKYDVEGLADDLCTYLDTSGEQRTARLPE